MGQAWCALALAALAGAAGCDDDPAATNRLLLWAVPRAISSKDLALVVADVTDVAHAAARDGSPQSGCVVITSEAGLLSSPSDNDPPPADQPDGGLPACVRPRCIFRPASSTQDDRRRAYAIYRANGPAGTDVLTASYYADANCPVDLSLPPTVSAPLVVTILDSSSRDASASAPGTPIDLGRGDQ